MWRLSCSFFPSLISPPSPPIRHHLPPDLSKFPLAHLNPNSPLQPHPIPSNCPNSTFHWHGWQLWQCGWQWYKMIWMVMMSMGQIENGSIGAWYWWWWLWGREMASNDWSVCAGAPQSSCTPVMWGARVVRISVLLWYCILCILYTVGLHYVLLGCSLTGFILLGYPQKRLQQSWSNSKFDLRIQVTWKLLSGPQQFSAHFP